MVWLAICFDGSFQECRNCGDPQNQNFWLMRGARHLYLINLDRVVAHTLERYAIISLMRILINIIAKTPS